MARVTPIAWAADTVPAFPDDFAVTLAQGFCTDNRSV
jgi:hypothetical protein